MLERIVQRKRLSGNDWKTLASNTEKQKTNEGEARNLYQGGCVKACYRTLSR